MGTFLSNRTQFILLFLFLLVFRTIFGCSQPFFSPDEMQTYLIGLKAYTNHLWPYFGPDLIVTETGFYTQIPGALEGLCVGLPFYLLPIPEAPFIFLNLLSLSALALLSFYISKRVREIPFLFIFAWLALLPWNLHESTNIINPSWLLFGSVFFFIGFLEAIPETSLKFWSPFTAFLAMGFGLFWNIQFHFSWVLLPPFIVLALAWRLWRGAVGSFSEIVGLLLGSLISGAFLLPTLIVFGLHQASSGLGLAVHFNWNNFEAIYLVLPRFLSLVCYELPRFLGPGANDRWDAVTHFPVMFLPAVFLWIVGILQAIVLFFMIFMKDTKHKDWKAVHLIIGISLVLVWASFWFTSKPPQAHMYYILLPPISVYSFYVWGRLAVDKRWRIFGIICLAASFWFEASFIAWQMPFSSLYTNRAKVANAIDHRDYTLLGERRPGSHN
jgi:hypothetical protein